MLALRYLLVVLLSLAIPTVAADSLRVAPCTTMAEEVQLSADHDCCPTAQAPEEAGSVPAESHGPELCKMGQACKMSSLPLWLAADTTLVLQTTPVGYSSASQNLFLSRGTSPLWRPPQLI